MAQHEKGRAIAPDQSGGSTQLEVGHELNGGGHGQAAGQGLHGGPQVGLGSGWPGQQLALEHRGCLHMQQHQPRPDGGRQPGRVANGLPRGGEEIREHNQREGRQFASWHGRWTGRSEGRRHD